MSLNALMLMGVRSALGPELFEYPVGNEHLKNGMRRIAKP
jgi:hypothetical protein